MVGDNDGHRSGALGEEKKRWSQNRLLCRRFGPWLVLVPTGRRDPTTLVETGTGWGPRLHIARAVGPNGRLAVFGAISESRRRGPFRPGGREQKLDHTPEAPGGEGSGTEGDDQGSFRKVSRNFWGSLGPILYINLFIYLSIYLFSYLFIYLEKYSWSPIGPPLGGVLLCALRAVLGPPWGPAGTRLRQLGATSRPQEPMRRNEKA